MWPMRWSTLQQLWALFVVSAVQHVSMEVSFQLRQDWLVMSALHAQNIACTKHCMITAAETRLAGDVSIACARHSIIHAAETELACR